MKQTPALSPGRKARGAFTLIELLVVITIIGILSAILLQTAGYVQDKAARARAEAEIKALELAINNFKLDNGDFPTPDSTNGTVTSVDGQTGNGKDQSTKGLIQLLCPDPKAGKVYYQIPIKMLGGYKPGTGQTYEAALAASNYIEDPFGNPYHYYYSSAAAQAGGSATNPVTSSQNNGPQFVDLWSYGKNPERNKANPETWIKNW